MKKNIEEVNALLSSKKTWQKEIKMSRIRYKKFDNCFISDAVGDEYFNWNRGSYIGLIGNTGSGKNHFLEEIMIPNLCRLKVKILFVCNRISSCRQVKKNLLISTGMESEIGLYSEEGFDKLANIGNYIDVSSYQTLANEFVLSPYKIYNYDIVIFDEIQWGDSDSSLNKMTNLVLHSIVNKFSNALRVYVTATPDDILGEIINLEKTYNPISCTSKHQPIIYEIKNAYKFIKTIYKFNCYSDLLQAILHSDERWLVYVNNLKEGQAFRDLLEYNGISTSFIHSNSKKMSKTNAEDQLCLLNNGKFTTQVCIASRSIENGISIKDRKLKNIVIFACDKTLFLQMIGRKRIQDEGDFFTLYVQHIGADKVDQILNNDLRIFNILKNTVNKNPLILDLYENQESNKEVLSFYYYWRNCRYFNEIAYLHLLREISFYDSLSEGFEIGEDAYFSKIQEWLKLNIDPSQAVEFINEVQKHDFKELCDSIGKFVDVELDGDTLVNFKEVLKDRLIKTYGSEYSKKSLGVSNVRKLLAIHEIPYSLTTKGKNTWMFSHIQ